MSDMDKATATLVQGLKEGLSATFDVDPDRVDVRVNVRPLDEAEPAGQQLIRFEVDLDGKTPPPEWCEAIQLFVEFAGGISTALGHEVKVVGCGESEVPR